MQNFNGTRRKITYFFSTIFFGILFWLLFSPIQVGGRVAYVVVDGNSMEPKFHIGDLVISRKKSEYQINDAVVYHQPDLGHVFHRIVEKNDNGFTLKGDNNSWLDTYQPSKYL